MARDQNVRRLTLVPLGGDDSLRRYRLARMDDIALASPPYQLPENPRARRNGGDPESAPKPQAEEGKPQSRATEP